MRQRKINAHSQSHNYKGPLALFCLAALFSSFAWYLKRNHARIQSPNQDLIGPPNLLHIGSHTILSGSFTKPINLTTLDTCDIIDWRTNYKLNSE